MDTFPNSPAPYFKLALLAEKSGNKQEAINNYRKVISFDIDPYVSINRLAHLLVLTSSFESAINELKELKNKSQKSKAEFSVILGMLYSGKAKPSSEEIKSARLSFEEAIQIKPSFMPAYFALAALDQAEGNPRAAIEKYKKIMEAQPSHIPSLMLLALTYEGIKEINQAADVYRKILAVSPNFAPAANNLAWILAENLNTDIDEAVQLAQKAKQEMPNDPSITDTLGWVYHKQGSERSAMYTLEEAVQLDSTNERPNPEILLHLATVKNILGDSGSASELLQRSLKLMTPDHPKKAEAEALLKSIR